MSTPPVMDPIGLYSVGVIDLDTAINASSVPSPSCLRRLAFVAAFSWGACVLFIAAAIAAAIVERDAMCALSVVPLLIAAVMTTRDTIAERRRYLSALAAHVVAAAIVRGAMRARRESA